MPKNALSNTIPDPISFPGITHLFPREPEQLLCPVRVLGLYINKTQTLADQAGSDCLCVHFKLDTCTQVFTSHFRLWVSEANQGAYDLAPEEEKPQQINAYEVRAIAASISYYKKIPLDEIRSLTGWRSNEVFYHHFLRDIAVDQDLEGLPVVAAGVSLCSVKVHSQTRHLRPKRLSLPGWNIESI